MKVWNQPLFPVLDHNTMLTNYDVMIKKNEIDIIDQYVLQNNIPEMNLTVFRNVVSHTLPNWRAEQICGDFYHDDQGLSNYKKYITFEKA